MRGDTILPTWTTAQATNRRTPRNVEVHVAHRSVIAGMPALYTLCHWAKPQPEHGPAYLHLAGPGLLGCVISAPRSTGQGEIPGRTANPRSCIWDSIEQLHGFRCHSPLSIGGHPWLHWGECCLWACGDECK